MRMMRDSPPELARALPGPCASSSRTERPARRRCQAVQAPKEPAPTTATSAARALTTDASSLAGRAAAAARPFGHEVLAEPHAIEHAGHRVVHDVVHRPWPLAE